MRFFADLHIHSPYSRATSPLLTLRNIAIWSAKKGIAVIGTGDFTHPKWLSEIEDELKEAEDGLYKLKDPIPLSTEAIEPRFVISGEISCIYKKAGKLRKIHNLILLPDIESAKKLNKRLSKIGDLSADGRPVLGLDAKLLLEIVLEVSADAFFIPAHIWTPWFSLFGSKSGFDHIEECFEDLTKYIHALETGLSSDPPMNRLLSDLDSYVLVSNSDAHSLTRLGREANIFDTDLNYYSLVDAMKSGKGFLGTVEFFPEEGKYHLDGHRRCNVCLNPKESMALNNICPVCGNPLTIGVLHRVYELADREEPVLKKPFYSLIPLTEIISEIMDCGVETKKVRQEYERLTSELGSELSILMDVSLEDIKEAGGELLAEAIKRMREQKVIKKPGYDGEYGKIRLFEDGEKAIFSGQSLLFKISSKKNLHYKRDLPKLNKKKSIRSENLSKKSQQFDPILDVLNPAQREAVFHSGKNVIVVAGPGSGKTLTLTHRIAYLVRSGKAKPDQILAITFTNKAADEMRDRIEKLLRHSSDGIWISTFHSFCLWILREKGDLIGIGKDFSICSSWESEEIIRQVCGKKRVADKLLKLLPFVKSGVLKELDDSEVSRCYEEYSKKLKAMNMLDIDDLERMAFELLRTYPEIAAEISRMRPYIFVDEYQDTNPNQVGILKAISKAGDSFVFAIGDPDQAIYGFRGADRSAFLRFCEEFEDAVQISLDKNYRSAPEILKAGAAILDKEPMQAVSDEKGRIVIASCSTEKQEAEYIVKSIEKLIGGTSYFSLDSQTVQSHEGEGFSFGDIAVLYRINSIGDEIEAAFKKAGIPVIRAGEVPLREIYPVNVIYSLLLYLVHKRRFYWERYIKLVSDKGLLPCKDVSQIPLSDAYNTVKAILHTHEFGFEKDEVSLKAVNKILDIASDRKKDLMSFLDFLSTERGIDNIELVGDRISLMSLHSAKGLEWKAVFIAGCEEGVIPCTLFGNPDIDEEKRLFYVGITRAKKLLFLSHVKRRRLGSRVLNLRPSSFLEKIPAHLVESVRKKKSPKSKKEPAQLSLFG